MTPEERLTRIENSIQALIETQARHEAGIRDLIVVSRTLVDSHKETTIHIQDLRGTVQELANAQRATDTKLNTLIEHVDQLTRNVNALVQSLRKPNGNQ